MVFSRRSRRRGSALMTSRTRLLTRPAAPVPWAHLGPAALVGALVAVSPLAGRAQQAGYGQTFGTTPMERQIYEGGVGRPSNGSILDSTNPIELMNKIRRGTAMDDATPPASAIDQALRELEIRSASPTPSTAPGSATPSSPAASSRPVWSNATGGAPAAPVPVGTAQAAPVLTPPAAVPGSAPAMPQRQP